MSFSQIPIIFLFLATCWFATKSTIAVFSVPGSERCVWAWTTPRWRSVSRTSRRSCSPTWEPAAGGWSSRNSGTHTVNEMSPLGLACKNPGMLESRILARYDISRRFRPYFHFSHESYVYLRTFYPLTKIIWKNGFLPEFYNLAFWCSCAPAVWCIILQFTIFFLYMFSNGQNRAKCSLPGLGSR